MIGTLRLPEATQISWKPCCDNNRIDPKHVCFDCSAWLKIEVKDKSWLDELPDCPCSLQTRDWKRRQRFLIPPGFSIDPNPFLGAFHPGAYLCLRSGRSKSGAGQQCCYDDNLKLITHGSGAGTPDKSHASDPQGHTLDYVKPFEKCSLDVYLEARPPNGGPKGSPCAKNP